METHNQTRQKSTKNQLGYISSRLLMLPIQFYQYVLSPWFGQNCRFYPTCSHYALESLEQHGPIRGIWLTLKRLGKCHPWYQGGYDPVPPNTHSQHKDG